LRYLKATKPCSSSTNKSWGRSADPLNERSVRSLQADFQQSWLSEISRILFRKTNQTMKRNLVGEFIPESAEQFEARDDG